MDTKTPQAIQVMYDGIIIIFKTHEEVILGAYTKKAIIISGCPYEYIHIN